MAKVLASAAACRTPALSPWAVALRVCSCVPEVQVAWRVS